MSEQDPTPATTTPPTPTTATPPAENTTLMGIFAYLGPLVFIPLLTAKEQPFVRFHVRQGLALFVLLALVWVIDEMIYFGRYWQLIDFAYLAIVIFSIIGIMNVLGKQEKELPLLGSIAKRFTI